MHPIQKHSYLLSVKNVQQVLQTKVVEELTDTDFYTDTETQTNRLIINYNTAIHPPLNHQITDEKYSLICFTNQLKPHQ